MAYISESAAAAAAAAAAVSDLPADSMFGPLLKKENI